MVGISSIVFAAATNPQVCVCVCVFNCKIPMLDISPVVFAVVTNNSKISRSFKMNVYFLLSLDED